MKPRICATMVAGLFGLSACTDSTIHEPRINQSTPVASSTAPVISTRANALILSGGSLRITGFTTKNQQFYNPCVDAFTYSSANVVWFPNGQRFDVQRDDVTLCTGYEYYNGGVIKLYLTAGDTTIYAGHVDADSESFLIHDLPPGTSARLVADPDNMQGCVFQVWWDDGSTGNPRVVNGASSNQEVKGIFDCP